MSENQMIKFFESIPKFDSYSRYNSNLEKVFKSSNVKYLLELLKHQKEIKQKESNLTEDIQRDIYAQEESTFNKIKNEDDVDIFDENYKVKETPKIITREKIMQELFQNNVNDFKKRKLRPSLDPFKYHPNYKAIYRNIPSVRIINPKKAKKHFKTLNDTQKNSKDKISPDTKEGKVQNTSKTDDKNISKSKDNKTLNSITLAINKKGLSLPKLKKISKGKKGSLAKEEYNNHAMRFSKYLGRKNVVNDNNKIISYLGLVDYILPKEKNKSIDFDKMSKRKDRDLVNGSNQKTPSFGQYNPVYTQLDKNEKVVLFDPENKIKQNHKKYFMKKIWASYQVNSDYLSVNKRV